MRQIKQTLLTEYVGIQSCYHAFKNFHLWPETGAVERSFGRELATNEEAKLIETMSKNILASR